MADDRMNLNDMFHQETVDRARALFTVGGHNLITEGMRPVMEAQILRPDPTYKIDFDRVNSMAEVVGLLRAFFGDTYMTRKKAEEHGIDHLLDI